MRCGRRKHAFWDDTVGGLLIYPTEPRPWANKMKVIAHNAKAFDIHFILGSAILLKWNPEPIMNCLKKKVHEDGALGLYGQRVVPPVSAA